MIMELAELRKKFEEWHKEVYGIYPSQEIHSSSAAQINCMWVGFQACYKLKLS
jgi:hypothetical protein